MPYLIRSSLVIFALALAWSTVTFVDDGVVVFVPHVGGYFFGYTE